MSDDDESEEPAVTLGAKQAVEGAPLARVTARLMWGIEKSAIREREGDTVVRTPDGPTELGTLLDDVDTQYFSTRQEFETALREVIGDGPVPAESSESGTEAAGEEADGEAPEDDATAGDDSDEEAEKQADNEEVQGQEAGDVDEANEADAGEGTDAEVENGEESEPSEDKEGEDAESAE